MVPCGCFTNQLEFVGEFVCDVSVDHPGGFLNSR